MQYHALVELDGQILKPEEAKVSVFDRGFLFGDGVYETGRTYDRCPLFLDEHLARLRRSADKLFIDVPWTNEEIKGGLFKLCRAFGSPDLYFRLILTRGCIDHVGLDVMDSKRPTLVKIAQALTSIDDLRKRGLHLLTSHIWRNAPKAQDPNIKTSNYLNSLLALQDVKARGADDGILCDPNGNVTEGTTFSIFGVTNDDVLITSSLEVGILDSITRKHVLSIGRKLMRVEEGFFPLEKFQACREVFIASSVREIVPVSQWDGKTYSPTGSRTKRLHEKLSEEIRAYVDSNEKF